jgi:TonB family protein
MTRLILLTAIALAASAQPAHELALKARSAALDRADWKKAESLIDSALQRWERDQEPHDADYGRALDLAGMLAQRRKADLTTVVEPLYREALDILDHAGSAVSESDKALALELEALALTDIGQRALDAGPLKERALKVRNGIIRDMQGLSPSPSVTGPVSKLGNGIKGPQVISKREPAYNNLARMLKVQGTVILQLVIAADGTPYAFHLFRSVGFGLDEEAVRVVKEWRFRPATRDDNAIAVYVTIEVNFRLL